jgi:hypothetical protein
LLSWELLLAGEASRHEELEALPAPRGIVELGFESAALPVHALSAAAAGDRDRYDASMAALSVGRCRYSWLSADLSCLQALASVNEPASGEPAPFADGTVDQIPRGLSNLAPADSPPALVVARPSTARRLLLLGLPLLRSEEPTLRIYDDTHERIDSIIACLALHGGRMVEQELFERVYGFAFRPRIHAGSFRVNLHRVRSRLEGQATVRNSEQGVELEVNAPFAIFDPRTGGTADDLLLHAIAVEGRLTAKAAARATGLPLRTVQRNLRGLVDAGLCQRERRGNEVLYLVEDTTFSEPTRH